jgi:short-subunit dehydrogenase
VNAASGEFAARYGRWAVVAGSSEGLGEAFADEAAARGLDVVLVARREGALAQAAARITTAHGVDVRAVVADLADADAPARVLAATDDLEVGLFIYNAAASAQGPFVDVELDLLLTNIAVNVTAPTVLTHSYGRRMKARGRGGIALVSSMAALQGTKVFAAYAGAKSYELILGEGLWDELRDHGVDAIGYVVGATATPTMLATRGLDADAPAEETRMEAGDGRPIDPRTPQAVARALYDVLGTGPRGYSHPDDRRHAEHGATLPREEVVSAMGKITSAFWE